MRDPKVPDFGGDWRMPSDAVVTLWQQELDDLSTQKIFHINPVPNALPHSGRNPIATL